VRVGYWAALAVSLCALSAAMSFWSSGSDSLTAMAASAVIDAAVLVVGLHLLGCLAWLGTRISRRDDN